MSDAINFIMTDIKAGNTDWMFAFGYNLGLTTGLLTGTLFIINFVIL